MRCRDLWPALIVSTCLVMSAAAQKPLPQHERETRAAWQALQEGKLQDAIRHADVCIREFRGAAARKQAALAGAGAIVPLGVVDERRKKSIFANGPLNDVATCYYVKGRAAHAMGQVHVAAKSHAEAMKYPLARAWDERGWFWSPAEAAQRFLADPAAPDKALHEVYTGDAWAAFGRGEHAQAVAIADKCVEQFRQRAIEMQKAISARGESPPDGEIPENLRKRILQNGILNDVATCLFIKGQSAEAMGDRVTAENAYRAAMSLGHGRAWDDRGWFWSPAKASANELEALRR